MALSKETLMLLAKYPDTIDYPEDHPVILELREAIEADTYQYGRHIIRYDANTCEQTNYYQDVRHVTSKSSGRALTVILEASKRQDLHVGSYWRFADQDIKPNSALGLAIERKRNLRGVLMG